MSKNSEIVLNVKLDEKNVPSRIDWKSDDSPTGPEQSEAKAFLLSIYEKETRETLRIDLWTNEMQVGEMDRLVFSTLKGITDTYFKATQNHDLANDMRRFVQYFGEKTEILKKE